MPFFRLNPHRPYETEFARCLERGFRGLKLHPVSQKFELDDPKAVELFRMAAEADLPVIIHAGFGMQRIVEPLLPTVEAHPELRLILGHSAMVEVLEAARVFADHPNVIFETSVAKSKDIYVLMRSLDHSRICYGSDIHTGTCPRLCTPRSGPRPPRATPRRRSPIFCPATSGGGSGEAAGRKGGRRTPHRTPAAHRQLPRLGHPLHVDARREDRYRHGDGRGQRPRRLAGRLRGRRRGAGAFAGPDRGGPPLLRRG